MGHWGAWARGLGYGGWCRESEDTAGRRGVSPPFLTKHDMHEPRGPSLTLGDVYSEQQPALQARTVGPGQPCLPRTCRSDRGLGQQRPGPTKAANLGASVPSMVSALWQ